MINLREYRFVPGVIVGFVPGIIIGAYQHSTITATLQHYLPTQEQMNALSTTLQSYTSPYLNVAATALGNFFEVVGKKIVASDDPKVQCGAGVAVTALCIFGALTLAAINKWCCRTTREPNREDVRVRNAGHFENKMTHYRSRDEQERSDAVLARRLHREEQQAAAR
jgi:hypothetical protein